MGMTKSITICALVGLIWLFTDNSKEHMLANAAPRDDPRTAAVQVGFGKRPCCSAVTTVTLGSSNIERKHFIQFACGSVAVKIRNL